jgi:MYXO-CTERM domain-containing protein
VTSPAAISGTSLWTESFDGDLSNDRLDPTGPLLLGLGPNDVFGSTVSGDRDYLTLTVPAGHYLTKIVPILYSGDDLAFIGVETGDQIDTLPVGSDPATLDGWTHFGVAEGNIGTNILPAMGMGAGAIGFIPPLPAGNYSFWIQETSPTSVSYGLRFLLSDVPAPGALALLALAGACPRSRRRRRAI